MRRAHTKLQLIHSKPDRTLSSITALINEYEPAEMKNKAQNVLHAKALQ